LILNESNFDSKIKAKKTVFVQFTANWCKPCEEVKKVLQQLKTKMNGKVEIAEIDIEKNPMVGVKYDIRSLPTLLIFKNGCIKNSISGTVKLNKLMEQI